MPTVSSEPPPTDTNAQHAADDVPQRLRAARERTGLSLRQLAQRLEISPSALSQIETGKSRPSVRTLYAVVSELNLSLDELFSNHEPAPSVDRPGDSFVAPEHLDASARLTMPDLPDADCPLQPADTRARLELDSGVCWDRLTSHHDPFVDFLQVTYPPGSASNANGTLLRHPGREYGVILSGAIDVTIGFETYHCQAGDSISFRSDEPHLLANKGDVPATAIWFVLGRRSGGALQPPANGRAHRSQPRTDSETVH